MPTAPAIHHVPYGIEHPYEVSPVERQPRQPIAGEPLGLGVQTTPAGLVTALHAVVTINDGADQWIAADMVATDDNATSWRATLPPLQAGDRLRYHFQAEPGAVRTESYQCTVAGWQAASRLRHWQRDSDWLRLDIEPNLTVTLNFGHTAQVQLRYSVGQAETPPSTTGAPVFTLEEQADHLLAIADGMRVLIQRNPYRLTLLSAAGEVLFDESSTGGVQWLTRTQETLRIVLGWQTPTDERFFGFGERFNAFDQRGQQIDTLVYEQYKNQDKRTYLPVPFFISSLGYGLWLDTARRAYFDLAASQPNYASFAVETDTLDLTFFVGEPLSVLSAFTACVGRAALPPKWAFGLWMSSNEWNSQAQVLEQVALTSQHAIPATVLVIEAWSDEATFYLFNDARYTPRSGDETFSLRDFTFPPDGRWPEPQALVDELHNQGIHLILWQIPVFKKLDEPHPQHDRDVAHALARQLVVQEADGSPYRIRPFWFHDGFVPDFSNPELERWWFARRCYLIDELGVDGFKTDGGEHIWGASLRAFDGSRGADLINRFPHLYEAAYARFAGPQRILFSRAGYTGSQAFSTHWAGDENSTFAAFRHSITAGLSASASGFTFWGWDLGGFGGDLPSAELYLRATAMATFCPIMQYHSEYNPQRHPSRDRTPWHVASQTNDPTVIPTFRFFANLRMNLLPHIWSEAIKASRSGLPLMRALPLVLPHEQQAVNFPYQYLFGENLLVAPVVWEGCTAIDVYLPAGDWYDFWTGEHHSGGTVLRYPTPLNRIPVFVRAGSVVALHLAESQQLGDSVGNGLEPRHPLIFRSYPGRVNATFDWYHDPASPPQSFAIASI